MAASAGSIDPAGLLAWQGVSAALLGWLVGNCTVKPGLMVAAGAAVTGLADLAFSDPASLGPLLAAGAGSTDKAGIDHWTTVGKEIVKHLTSFAKGLPGAFVAIPLGGAIAGTGTILVVPPIIPGLPGAAGSTDPIGIIGWLAIGAVVCAHVAANAQMLAIPIGFTSISGGGPLIGSGTII